MIPVACPFCKFYSPNLKDPSGLGLCHRRPPVGFPTGPNQTITVWPVVGPHNWCGDGEAGVSHDSLQAGKDLMKGRGNGNGHKP